MLLLLSLLLVSNAKPEQEDQFPLYVSGEHCLELVSAEEKFKKKIYVELLRSSCLETSKSNTLWKFKGEE